MTQYLSYAMNIALRNCECAEREVNRLAGIRIPLWRLRQWWKYHRQYKKALDALWAAEDIYRNLFT
jgi:hypothetical protein